MALSMWLRPFEEGKEDEELINYQSNCTSDML